MPEGVGMSWFMGRVLISSAGSHRRNDTSVQPEPPWAPAEYPGGGAETVW
ncbi:hypothetical protein GCM10023086_69780 [Streptomyces venetus]|uniref:Uncharacterized protein n=1 Tax=Streptomyces venetus TaxID=1701086 RepID=A0ABP8HAD5_9ACTN